MLDWPSVRGHKPVDITLAIPTLSRIIRHYFGGSVMPGEEYCCWKCGYWLFSTETGVRYCVYCGHVHHPPTPVYRPAIILSFWTEEGTLSIV